jgi:outer membrane protein
MKVIILILSIFFIGLSSVTLYLFNSKDNIKYVSMTIVFQEANLKQKYQEELKSFETKSTEKLMSIQKEINLLKQNNKNATYLEEQFKVLKEKLSTEYQTKSSKYEELIWKEINSKISKYSKDNNIDFVLGAKGDGSIMYASESKDITKEVVNYINTGK